MMKNQRLAILVVLVTALVAVDDYGAEYLRRRFRVTRARLQ